MGERQLLISDDEAFAIPNSFTALRNEDISKAFDKLESSIADREFESARREGVRDVSSPESGLSGEPEQKKQNAEAEMQELRPGFYVRASEPPELTPEAIERLIKRNNLGQREQEFLWKQYNEHQAEKIRIEAELNRPWWKFW